MSSKDTRRRILVAALLAVTATWNGTSSSAEDLSSTCLFADNSEVIRGDYCVGDPFPYGGRKYVPMVKSDRLRTGWDVGWILPSAYIVVSEKSTRVVQVPWADFDPDNPLSLLPGALGTLLAIGPSAALHMAENVPIGPNRWSADRSHVLEGGLLFEPHILESPVPIYPRSQVFKMTIMVDWDYQMATYPEFYQEQTADLVRFNATSSWTQIGDPAPDFEIPTVDGGRLRLSEYRGKIIVFNFCSIT